MNWLIEFSVFLTMPVLFVHLALDLFDKHRHGIKVHDFIGIVTYVVLALHISFDILGMVG